MNVSRHTIFQYYYYYYYLFIYPVGELMIYGLFQLFVYSFVSDTSSAFNAAARTFAADVVQSLTSFIISNEHTYAFASLLV